MSFRDNLKNELEYQDMQLKELAAKTGISKNTLGNYLSGHHSIPSADTAVKIARALGVSVEFLVTGKDIAKPDNRQIPLPVRKIIDDLIKLDPIDLEEIQVLLSVMKKRY